MKDYSTPAFIAVLRTIAKIQQQPLCTSADEWVKNRYLYAMEYYSFVKKNEILLFVTAWMDLESTINEVSQRKKDKYHVISLIRGI